MSAHSELGPSLRPLGEMRRIAVDAHQLALILLDITGPGGDALRAARTLARLRALVGGETGGEDHLEQGGVLRLREK